MSFRKGQTSLDETVADDVLTVEEIDLLTKCLLAELSQDIQGYTGDRAVKAGVIRHTSYPSQPLAYYYITERENKILYRM